MASVGSLDVLSRLRLRAVLRDALVYAGVVLAAPLWLPAWAERRLRLGEGWFVGCAELLSLVPGKPGIFLRRSFYRMTLDRCATDAHVGFGTLLTHPDAEIHGGVYIGLRCTVGKAVLEQDVTIGSNADILSGRRQHGTSSARTPIQRQAGEYGRVTVGRNSWIGNSTLVMADIGAESVIGAGAVVVKSVPARSVA